MKAKTLKVGMTVKVGNLTTSVNYQDRYDISLGGDHIDHSLLDAIGFEVVAPALSPCPFCGGDNSRSHGGGLAGYIRKCAKCGAEGPVRDTVEEAALAWNKREGLNKNDCA